ncbi:unnamed protein product [Dovyalis caffra]|uniref:Uncharacterized protein n=1 Tax=Dovyalis caffra TaxID=77055 RepID=A0AAV1RRA6_9ROSI|nr:unnamed protein product [Dovyalis caffra]
MARWQPVGDLGFLLAIWLDQIPERTIVWSANRNDPVRRGSRVQLATDGQLVLDDQAGTQIWGTFNSGGSGAAYAAMLDTGNFALASQSAANLWQSFDQPTDTMLPTQTLSRGNVYPKIAASSRRNWDMAWTTLSPSITSNICLSTRGAVGGEACGYNSYCSLGDDQRPSCYCPHGYTLLVSNDVRKGYWPGSNYKHFDSVHKDRCRQACLSDCYCVVAIFNDCYCWMKNIPLSNGRIDPSDGAKALIKVRIGNSTTGPSSKKNDRSTLIITGSALLATGGFKEELGSGSIGTVYKGVLANEDTPLIAVKLEKMVGQGEQEFKTEVKVIGRTNHKTWV